MKLMVALLLAFFVIFAFWYSRHERKGSRQGWFLVASIILFGSYLLTSGAFDPGDSTTSEYRLFLSNLCVMLFMPCAYLFTRQMVSGRNINRRDWLHVLPTSVYLINAFLNSGMSVLSASYPGEIMRQVPAGFLTFSHYVVLAYLFLQLQILIPQIREICQPLTRSFYPALRWILLLMLAQSYFLWYQVAGASDPRASERLWLQIPVIFECFLIVGIYVMHLIGKFLASQNEPIDSRQLEHVEVIEQLETIPVAESPFPVLTEEAPLRIEFQDFQFRQIEEKVRSAIAGQKQFLTPGYTIRMLSEETGIAAHLLSAFINRCHGMNFNDFINEYRIHYCIEKIKNDEWKYKTLEALSRESGFNNRNSFTLSFKKVVGVTPSDFLKTLKV